MPPRRRDKQRKTTQAYVWGDTPEIQALGAGFAQEGYFMEGYDRARRFANDTTAKALAAQPGVRNARYAYMVGVPGSVGRGDFALGMTTPDVITAYGLDSETTLKQAFKQGLLPNDPLMPGFQRSIVNGRPLMKTYHYPSAPP
jgi:hypothetical protein